MGHEMDVESESNKSPKKRFVKKVKDKNVKKEKEKVKDKKEKDSDSEEQNILEGKDGECTICLSDVSRTNIMILRCFYYYFCF
jgi:hypothetical protein